MKVGFIGLGIMGRPMAKHLIQAGHAVMVSDIKTELEDELVSLGASKGNYAQMGETCEVVMTILPTAQIVQSVLFDEGGVAETMPSGGIIIDHSSVTPVESQACYEKLKAKGIGFLDAPVSGGEPGAIAGSLAIMVGGDDEVFDKVKPVMEAYASSILLTGESGSGSITKLANQIIVNNTIAIVSEALVFAAKAGADPEKVYKAIRSGLAGSAVLDAKAPMMLAHHFVPGGTIRVNHKDITNVVKTAHAIDAPIPYSAQLYEIMQVLKVHGYMGDDHAGIVRYFETLADCSVEQK
ncbi:NAD(P)-binding domain-containing protein [Peptoniphilus equinus]|uniref:NAD(P)-binding domain-containing protein n=1 Tax=Peptoniphilus equinus TaxID=3016343 RepID=A0ABY7QRG4_9FIRM|nr:NAD(P)-binding domain-containing protein [Peptoniphilus equinus]WBW49386.1 NAD(P)-binding domain-containing protein [Peptoniphilus equinus]